jgi:hypothetical protein
MWGEHAGCRLECISLGTAWAPYCSSLRLCNGQVITQGNWGAVGEWEPFQEAHQQVPLTAVLLKVQSVDWTYLQIAWDPGSDTVIQKLRVSVQKWHTDKRNLFIESHNKEFELALRRFFFFFFFSGLVYSLVPTFPNITCQWWRQLYFLFF